MLSRFTALALLLLAGPALAAAQDVDLKPKYEKGQTIVYDAEVKMNQILMIGGSNVESGVNIFETRKIEVLDKTDTRTKLKMTTPKMQFEASLPGGNTLSFDSENPDKEGSEIPGLGDVSKLLKVACNLQISLDIDNTGKVEEMSLEADGLDTLPEAFQSQLSKDRIKPKTEQEFKRYPSDRVKPGDSWTRTEVFDAGQGQYFQYTTTYKYEGRVTEDGKMYDKVTCTYDKPKFDIEAGSALPLSVKSSELSMDGSTGTLLLDTEDHHISKFENKSVFKGKIVFTLPDAKELPGELDLTVNSKLTRQ